MTVRRALALPALRAGDPRVLSGASRLDTGVRWVHVAEVADVRRLLTGRELVLTTGIAMAPSEHAAAAVVDRLVEAGAAGLVVELGEQLPHIPARAVNRALEASLPLVELRRPVRFVDVTEEVHRAIVADQLERVEFATTAHETFTRLSLAAAGAPDIVAAAAGLAGVPLVLEDLARRVVACSHTGRGTEELLRDWEQRSRLTPLTVGTGRSGPEHWMGTPVGIRGGVWGRLVALGPDLDETRARLVLERAAQALELGRMIERDEIALQLRAQGGFLLGLLEDRLGSEADAVSRLAALGVRPGQAYVGVAVGRATGATAHDRTPARQAVELSERLAEVLASQGVDGAVGMVAADRVGALVALPTPEAELPTVDRLARALGALDHDLRLGVGGVHPRLLGAAASLRAARRVVEVAVTMPGGDRIAFRHADVRLNGLLGALRDDVRVQEFVESELGPLLEREARGPSGLLQLLRDYVEVGGNKVELSRRTHRSRSALYVRLEELQRVLGCSLDEPRSRLALGVALLAYDQQHAV